MNLVPRGGVARAGLPRRTGGSADSRRRAPGGVARASARFTRTLRLRFVLALSILSFGACKKEEAAPAKAADPAAKTETKPADKAPEVVHLLSIKHHRQLSFDFEGFWQANHGDSA